MMIKTDRKPFGARHYECLYCGARLMKTAVNFCSQECADSDQEEHDADIERLREFVRKEKETS